MKSGTNRFRPFAEVESHLRNPAYLNRLGYPDASIKEVIQLHRSKDGGGSQSQLAKLVLDDGTAFIVKQSFHENLRDQDNADRNIRRALGIAVNDSPFVLLKRGETFGSKNALMIFPMVDGISLTHNSITSSQRQTWLAKVGAALGEIHLVCLQNQNKLEHFYNHGCDLTQYKTLAHADLQASNVMLGRNGRVYLVDTEGTQFTKKGPEETIKDLWISVCFKDPNLMHAALEGYLSNFDPSKQQLVLENIRAQQAHLNIPESAFPKHFPVTPNLQVEIQMPEKASASVVTTSTEKPLSKPKKPSASISLAGKRNILEQHLQTKIHRGPDTSEESNASEETILESPDEISALLQKNVAQLIREGVIELPSHIQTQDLLAYLQGTKELASFLQNKGPARSQQRAGVGHASLSDEAHLKLQSELQSAFARKGITEKPISTPEHREKHLSRQSSASSSVSSNSSSSAVAATITPEYIKRRLNAIFDAGVISTDYPLTGEHGLIKSLLSEAPNLEKRHIDEQFKTRVSAHKQAGIAVQNREIFLTHAKRFSTVSNLLTKTTESEQPDPITIQSTAETQTPPTDSLPTKPTKHKKSMPNPSEDKENIAPLLRQNSIQSEHNLSIAKVYENTWQDFKMQFKNLARNEKDGFMTNNAFKAIEHFVKTHKKEIPTATEKHKRLEQLRTLLLGIHLNNIKNPELKETITGYLSAYQTLPEFPSPPSKSRKR